MNVLAGDRQALEAGQQLATDRGEAVGAIAADIEDLGSLLLEGVQAHREHCQLAGRSRCLEVAAGIRIEACGSIGIDFAYFLGIAWIGSRTAVAIAHVGGRVVTGLQALQDLLGRITQRDAQMVDQLQLALRIDLRIQRQLGVGRATSHQRATGVVADAAQHRGTDAGRADHRMRFATQRGQRLLQAVQRGTGQAQHLAAFVQQLDAGQAQRVDQHDRPAIVIAVRGRAAGQAGVGRLQDDRRTALHRCLQHAPQFQQRPRAHHRQHWAIAKTVAAAEAARSLVAGHYMAIADRIAQLCQHGVVAAHGRLTSESRPMSAMRRAPVRVIATRISLAIRSSRLATPASPCAASA